MVSKDKLTGLLNRETFDEDINTFFSEAQKSGNPLGLVIVDLDYFKKVNDNHGHKKGDDVLQDVSRLLTRVAINKGRVYRYGGEEIVFLLPNYTVDEALTIAERARRKLESEKIAGLSITASFGVASSSEKINDTTALFKAADDALYDAKNRGRNLVRAYGEPEPKDSEQREPVRKKPKLGHLTEKQKSELYLNHFKGRQIVCPKDGALLEVENISEVGSPTQGLIVYCPVCGLVDKLYSPER